MQIKVFNIALIVGWLMMLAGGIMLHPGWGIAIAGAVLVLMTLLMAYLAGFAPESDAKPGERA